MWKADAWPTLSSLALVLLLWPSFLLAPDENMVTWKKEGQSDLAYHCQALVLGTSPGDPALGKEILALHSSQALSPPNQSKMTKGLSHTPLCARHLAWLLPWGVNVLELTLCCTEP